MPVADFAQNVQTPFFPMVRHTMDALPGKHAKASTAAPADTKTASSSASGDGKSFWQDVLDVVNPLQHLPVVGTVYRAITGDKMGDVEKVAGDTLYGGPIGFVSSLADVAFEKLTGKDFGDTVLSLFEGGSGTTAVAANTLKPLPSRPSLTATAAPVSLTAATPANPDPIASQSIAAKVAAAQSGQSSDTNTQALLTAMNQNGVNSDLGMRALFAYQKSLGLSPIAETGADPAP
ncbi:MAG TPA: hypothetical protein VHU87_09600 [Rhizomicrobium sp.]|jgi:hypothetical protein|nr:hypothetical protein [Rhizomicrobium sp.]